MPAQALALQRPHEVADADVGVGVAAHVDAIADRPDGAVTGDLRRPAAEVHVGEQRPEVDHQVGVVDALPDRGRTERADVDAHELRVVHREGALAEDRRHAGRAHALDQLHDVALQLVAEGLDADDHGRPAGGVEARGGLARRLGGLALVGARELEGAVPGTDRLRHLDGALHHVAVDLEVAGPLLAPDRAHHAIDLVRDTARIVENGRGTADLVVDAELRLDLLRLVMDELPELALLLARPAAHDQDRHPFRERPGDGVHHVVAAGAVGDADDADAARGARVAVGGEADARLVRQGHDLEPARAPELEEQVDHEVARNAEQMRDPDLLEIRDQEVADAHPRPHHAKNSSTLPVATSIASTEPSRKTCNTTCSPARCAHRRS